MRQTKNCLSNPFFRPPIMWLYKLQGVIYLSTFHVEYVALSQSTRDLVPNKILVIEVVKAVGQDSRRLEFNTHLTVFEDNYGVFKAT